MREPSHSLFKMIDFYCFENTHKTNRFDKALFVMMIIPLWDNSAQRFCMVKPLELADFEGVSSGRVASDVVELQAARSSAWQLGFFDY